MNNDFDPKGNYLQDMPELEVKRRYTPEEAGHDKHRKPVTRVHRNRRKRINPGIFLVSLVLCAVIGVSLYFIISSSDNRTTEADPLDSLKEGLEAVVPEDDGRDYYTEKLSLEDIHCGDLILVNANTEYKFPKSLEDGIVNIVDYKNEYYLAKQNDAQLNRTVIEKFNTLCADLNAFNGFSSLQVNSAYRSLQSQIDTYEMYKEQNGEEYAKSYVANPGFSEHHTGLSLDLNINRGGKISYVETDPEVEWFRDNAKNYGFILRYPKDKVYLTGINYESWHYRYVGVPHAQIMAELNMCLEEYITYIKGYTYETERITYSAETGIAYDKYEEGREALPEILVYYSESAGETTEIKIPKGYEYSVSGNNTDGFIITAIHKNHK